MASSPILVSPAKNSTLAIEPSASVASAVIATWAPGSTLSPSAGAVIATSGDAVGEMPWPMASMKLSLMSFDPVKTR